MAGLVPAIHESAAAVQKGVDGRVTASGPPAMTEDGVVNAPEPASPPIGRWRMTALRA